MEHVAPIVARVTAELARRQVRHLDHEIACPFWERIDPAACRCSARPLIDLLLHLAQQRAA
jgi:hypothetical protein